MRHHVGGTWGSRAPRALGNGEADTAGELGHPWELEPGLIPGQGRARQLLAADCAGWQLRAAAGSRGSGEMGCTRPRLPDKSH